MPRKYPDEKGEIRLAEGEYGKDPRDGIWYARAPGMHMASLAGHEVTEHEDGTITVSPSILVTQDDALGGRPDCEIRWHGYLIRGEWKTA